MAFSVYIELRLFTDYFLTVNTIRVAKPEKGEQLEKFIIQLATSGRLMGKMSEQELISLVEQLNRQTAKTSKVKVNVVY